MRPAAITVYLISRHLGTSAADLDNTLVEHYEVPLRAAEQPIDEGARAGGIVQNRETCLNGLKTVDCSLQ